MIGSSVALAEQRRYLDAIPPKTKLGLTMPEAFVRGIRDMGYRSSGDAIAEFIDNSIQAYAERVDVLIEAGPGKEAPSRLAVVDDGHGMEPAMIRLAVTWGGTHRENDRAGLGRYGYGLPSSAVSLGRRFTVFSRTSDGVWEAVTLDLDEIAQGAYHDAEGDIVVPATRPAPLPPFVARHVRSVGMAGPGTVVLIEKLDRLQWSTRGRLRSNLGRQFGVTYHKLRNQTELWVDGHFVEPIDPLFLAPEHSLSALDDDRSVGLDPMRVELHHPIDGRYLGALAIRYAWLPPSFGSIEKSRMAVGLNANARFAVMKAYHGVIFSRNGRLIDVQQKTPWTGFINNDRYVRVEVEFPAVLDEWFGVTTSKQQVTISDFVWDALQTVGMPKAIEQLRGKVRQEKAIRRSVALSPPPGEPRLSEIVMSNQAIVSEAAPDRGTRRTVCFEHEPRGPFFRIEGESTADRLVLNTAHRFYSAIYDGPNATDQFRCALEILLFTTGRMDVEKSAGEGGEGDGPETVSWSDRLDQALCLLAQHIGEDEQASLLA